MQQILESLFIPESSLQGAQFPIHLTWQKDRALQISINAPNSNLEILAIHNVPKEGFEISGDVTKVKSFEKNGYLGMVFGAKLVQEPLMHVTIKIVVESSDGMKQETENTITLFRQHITLHKLPPVIDVIQEATCSRIINKIQVRNEGHGTAIVKFRLLDNSDGIIKKPADIQEFATKFCTVLREKYDKTGELFPKYCRLTNEFRKILEESVQGTYVISKRYVTNAEKVFEALNNAIQEDEDYLKSLLDGIYNAYVSSVHLITEVHGFVEYLKSLAKNKILLQSATSVIELKPGENHVEGCLEVTDLANNSYDPMEIQTVINVKESSPVCVPLYSIFEWLE